MNCARVHRLFLRKIQRANAISADRIIWDIKCFAEPHGLLTVQDLEKSSLMNVAERMMEKARTDRPIRFDHSGYPRSVASRSDGGKLAEMSLKMEYDSP